MKTITLTEAQAEALRSLCEGDIDMYRDMAEDCRKQGREDYHRIYGDRADLLVEIKAQLG